MLWQGRDAVGFFYLSQSGKTTELVYLGIAQGFRGRGLSRVLMGEVFKAARQNSSQILLTAVDDDNQPALRLYSRYPFHEASCFMFMERALAGRSR